MFHHTLTRIVVDLTPLLPGGANGGAKIMILALLRHLSQAASELDFVLLTSEKNHEVLAALEAANVQAFLHDPETISCTGITS